MLTLQVYWLQISGASVLSIADVVNGTYGEGTDKVFGDLHDADAVREIIRQNATRRVVDNFILNLTVPMTALVFAPIIYGQGQGIIKQRSIQIPELARVAIETGRVIQVGKGESTWSNVHISDVTDLFIKLVEKAAQKETDERMWNREGLYFPGNSMLVSQRLWRIRRSCVSKRLMCVTRASRVFPNCLLRQLTVLVW